MQTFATHDTREDRSPPQLDEEEEEIYEEHHEREAVEERVRRGDGEDINASMGETNSESSPVVSLELRSGLQTWGSFEYRE